MTMHGSSTMTWTRLEPVPQRGLLRTTGTVLWDAVHYRVYVPPGFYTDGASVPSWAWPLLGVGPVQMLVPGLIHDYCVRLNAVVEAPDGAGWWRTQPLRGPDQAINIMDDVMEWCDIGPTDRLKVRAALDATDRFYWQKKEMSWTGPSS